MTQFIRGT